ncbi:MAG: DoxX family protein [Acidimicrobiia bacterium]|nr:DoxX family protein [Acidimicrobiia bacterium]
MSDLTTAEFSMGLLVFRVIFGLVFALHGWGKVKNGIAGTAGWFESIGMRPGKLHAWAAALTEMGAGLLLAFGLLTPFASAAVIAVMIVAGYTVHRNNGFMIVKDGWEYTFVVALVAAFIALLGPGEYSLDHLLEIDDALNGYVGLEIAVAVGVVASAFQMGFFYKPDAPAE